MVCYLVPLSTAIGTLVMKKMCKQKGGRFGLLNMMLWGGAIMLVIDHLWNGELFLIGENIGLDLALGFAMTGTVIMVWAIVSFAAKVSAPKHVDA
jgi:hypothetical protein